MSYSTNFFTCLVCFNDKEILEKKCNLCNEIKSIEDMYKL